VFRKLHKETEKFPEKKNGQKKKFRPRKKIRKRKASIEETRRAKTFEERA